MTKGRCTSIFTLTSETASLVDMMTMRGEGVARCHTTGKKNMKNAKYIWTRDNLLTINSLANRMTSFTPSTKTLLAISPRHRQAVHRSIF